MKVIFIISILFLAGNAFTLPNCPEDTSSEEWHNCFGTYIAPPSYRGYSFGDKYVGEWQEGKFHGQGTFTRALPRVYGPEWVGEWKEGKLNGQGNFTDSNGSEYIGEFMDGKRHGLGIYVGPYGEQYDGQWDTGRRHGQGKITWPNGDQWIGEFWWGKQEKGALIKYIENDPRNKKAFFIERLSKTKNEILFRALEKEIDKVNIEIENQELILTALFDRCIQFGWTSDDHISACIKQEAYRDFQMQQQQHEMKLLEARLNKRTSTQERPFFLEILDIYSQQKQFELNKQMQIDIAQLKSSNRSLKSQQNTQNALKFLYEGD